MYPKDVAVPPNPISEVRMKNRGVAFLVPLLFLLLSPVAWPESRAVSARAVDRTAPVDEARRVTLRGSRHPLVRPEDARGALPADQLLERMVLVLRPDPVQQAALQELLRAQQDPASPDYHRWLTPEEFGRRFGVSSNDLARVTGWLQAHGMQVEEVPASRRTLVFTGSAAQVQSAFHTAIQSYAVRGEMHFANAADPQVPLALAPVVEGVVSMHDFRSAAQSVSPSYTAANGAHFLSPQDWDVIYDVGPLYRQGLDGTGQSIAVLGRVNVALADVRAFRSNSGLPPNDPQIILNGPDPGFPDCSDEAEAALDVEWAGAIAKNAAVKFVTSQSGATDGINLSALYAVNHNVAPIISLSYGLCEAAYSPAGNAFWNDLWAQAAAQGISVFVSSGDSGAAGCDSMNSSTATHGRGVNALCSSPYSTCVGGTQFNDDYNSGQYWLPSNGTDMSSVLSYIPEVAWNESGWSGALLSSSGGSSAIYSKPDWQNAPGVPADGARDVPDVALSGSVHDAYIIHIQGKPFYVAGTSAATPSLASVMALVLENTGAQQGNINPNLYALANLQLVSAGAAVFHDVTSGNNSVPGLTGFNAGPGYDLVTGLGSVDASVLVNHWSDAAGSDFVLSPSPSGVTLAPAAATTFSVTESARNAFHAPVFLSASGVPAGVTFNFSPTTVSSGSSTVTIAAASNTVPGTYAVTLTGTGGGLTRNAQFSLTVAPQATFTVSASTGSITLANGSAASVSLATAAVGGFRSTLSLSVAGLPRGLTASLSPASIASPGNGASTLKLTATSAAAGSYNLTVTARGAGVTQTVPLTLQVVVPSFFLNANASSAALQAGSPARVVFTPTPSNGFKSTIALSVSGLPRGVLASFSPASIAPGASSTLSLTLSSGAVSGTYTLSVKASGGGITATRPLTLTVLAPSFSMSLSGAAVSLRTGGRIPLTLTTAAVNGFNAAISLSASGAPRGVSATFSRSSIASPGNGSTTLTIAATTAAVPGTYNLTVTATGAGQSQTQKLKLTITR